MKLFEDMKELGGTVHDAIQHMVKNMFREELDDEQIVEIIDKLSLSDILALDSAYSEGDKETVQNILGPLPQLEYNMGGGRQASSNASSRPTTSGADNKAATQAATPKTAPPPAGGNPKAAPVAPVVPAPVATAPAKADPNQPEDDELEELEEVDEVDETEEYTDWVLCNNNDDSPAEEVTETNIVEMQAWLKRRAGIIT
jgi:hypothetical protein